VQVLIQIKIKLRQSYLNWAQGYLYLGQQHKRIKLLASFKKTNKLNWKIYLKGWGLASTDLTKDTGRALPLCAAVAGGGAGLERSWALTARGGGIEVGADDGQPSSLWVHP